MRRQALLRKFERLAAHWLLGPYNTGIVRIGFDEQIDCIWFLR
jgi:hypothetical protein